MNRELGYHASRAPRAPPGWRDNALPGLVNTHAHVDKSWWGLPGSRTAARAAPRVASATSAPADYGDALTVEVVAFPQDGVLRRPGVLELLADAARAGADHLGGLDPATIVG